VKRMHLNWKVYWNWFLQNIIDISVSISFALNGMEKRKVS